MTDTTALRTAINESGYKLRFLASQLNMSYPTLLKKLNGITEFKQSEICTLCALLKIDSVEKESIFFAS